MNVTMFGTGYVGLVTGACLAEVGNQVCCVDIDEAKISRLKAGEIPIFEPGLTELVKRNYASGNLLFTSDAQAAVSHGEVLFIAVGTPPDEDGSADLTYVLNVAQTIGELMDSDKVVVDKSTVPVGTADRVQQHIENVLEQRNRSELNVAVVSNPEFLKEGAAVSDFMKPDRVVIGTDNDAAAIVMRDLYAPFNRNHDRILEMDTRSAELTKYAANVMLATRISLMNEFSNLADLLGADVEMVRRGIGSDPRIGFQYIYPGCGYGGSCFPKDVQALARTARDVGYEAPITRGVELINERQKSVLFNKISQHFKGQLAGLTFAFWGLAFKPNTDDMREAPSRALMEALWDAGAKVRAYDPAASEECGRIYGARDDLRLCDSREETMEGCDALVVLTEWNEFKSPPYSLLKSCLQRPVVFDGRNLYDPESMENQGIAYYAIGRGRRA